MEFLKGKNNVKDITKRLDKFQEKVDFPEGNHQLQFTTEVRKRENTPPPLQNRIMFK